MGRNAYARHRGCAPNAVKKAEDDGRIAAAVKREADGAFIGIDWKLADQLWANNTDPAEAAKNGKLNLPVLEPVQTSVPLAPSTNDEAPAASAPGNDPFGYQQARAQREKSEAQLSEMKALREAGALTWTAGTKKEAVAIARGIRNAMLAIPDRVAPVLDPANPARAHKLLTDEISKALREFTVELEQRAAAAAGVGQPDLALL